MGQGGFGYGTGEHAGDFPLAFGTFHRREGRGIAFALHNVVNIGADGYLSEMGDDDDLVRLSKTRDFAGKRDGHRAARAGIDLVENERVHIVMRAENDLDCQHDAAHFSP